ncbi:MAG: hypothetical protein K2X71_24425 [Methylobacterium sp.]|uniref:hypothetical protein n=1 Tax=Methylobacterium sp. TaxID=409 RepID=UPI002588E23A|nr:hypothetical protein [Methylobacterium sp.]MBY0299143.1 hypothetical protein [Methylobacterium sp.]
MINRLMAGTILAVVTSTACLAQATGGSSDAPPSSAGGDNPRPDWSRRGPPDGDREGGWRGRPFMAGMKGARLRFHRGEVGMDLKCAADDSTKACVDALMPLVDKLLQGR